MLANITKYWYRKSLHPLTFLLLPLSYVFALAVALRRWCYRVGLFKSKSFSVPVIVVGNITVGGTGKTPFVVWLAKFLQEQGYKPGIVSRGVGGREHQKPYWVHAHTSPAEVGDEAILLAQNTRCPVVIGIDRAAAVEVISQHANCDIVISDDGMQHYRMQRNLEIVMVDSMLRFGNQQLLPAGPLRESLQRLKTVDFVVINARSNAYHPANEHHMSLVTTHLVSLKTNAEMNLAEFKQKKVHAVAGIGNPKQFFMALKKAGFDVIEHPFPDHYFFQKADLEFDDALPILMTEKDAVKCAAFADERFWYVAITAKMSHAFVQDFSAKLIELREACDVKEDASNITHRV